MSFHIHSYMDKWSDAPHECDDQKCKGNINRQKLEMWKEMYEFLRLVYVTTEQWSEDEQLQDIIARAEAIGKGEGK